MPRPIEFQDFPAALATAAPFGPYRAFVEEIVDGDTYSVMVSLGWDEYRFARIRLWHLDTPEIFHPANPAELTRGLAAKARATTLILRKPVILHTDHDVQTWGRFVASVHYLARDGKTLVSLADTLAAEGLAK